MCLFGQIWFPFLEEAEDRKQYFFVNAKISLSE